LLPGGIKDIPTLKDYIDEEIPGYFEFGPDGLGSFQFGYVQGKLDYLTLAMKNTTPSWNGGGRSIRRRSRQWKPPRRCSGGCQIGGR